MSASSSANLISPPRAQSRLAPLVWTLAIGVAVALAAGALHQSANARAAARNPPGSTVVSSFPISLGALEHADPAVAARFPTVLTHGMGDACSNPGFHQLTSLVSARTKTKTHCFADGSTPLTDTVNGFLLPLATQVEQFAAFVRSKPELAGGFNALGLSQGNLIIRGYISLHNDPPVLNFVSVHGPHAGVASVPRCNPAPGSHLTAALCDKLDDLLGDLAYTRQVQDHLAQANFFRDPLRMPQYLEGCHFLPQLLDQASRSPQVRKNFSGLQKLALVMAARDTMLEPKETAWFGSYEDGGWSTVKTAETSAWYESTGLGDLDRAKRVERIQTAGDHLEFSQAELNAWVDTFFLQQPQQQQQQGGQEAVKL
jgi:palmitoyl-protein thioesterase